MQCREKSLENQFGRSVAQQVLCILWPTTGRLSMHMPAQLVNGLLCLVQDKNYCKISVEGCELITASTHDEITATGKH